ncbi:response regulator transcription factor [bacterium SCSIO 12643]|nr:response regulator transcription factor [bacterium SCSIO 12643]
MRVLIIEDENLLANELKRTLANIRQDVEIVDQVRSVQQGKEWFTRDVEIDLIISDIQLIDGTSFELFKQVNIQTPIIFTTAYDEFALKAFKLNSIDYLLKPIDENDLKSALNKYESLWSKRNNLTDDVLNNLIARKIEKSYKSNFLIKVGDQYKRVHTHDIGFFYAEGNTVYLVKKDGKKLIVDFSLEQVTNQLDPKQFFRVNRHLLLNNTCIKGIHKYFNSRLKLVIQPEYESEVLVTRSRVNDFLSWMNY